MVVGMNQDASDPRHIS